jgi:uncharacterized protein (DUF1501 family)
MSIVISTPKSLARRRLLSGLGCALAAAGTQAFLPQLALLPRAHAAQSAGRGDYRALVCIYLAGANDSYNLLTPRDSELAGSRYDLYRSARGGVWSGANPAGLALGFNDLLPITAQGSGSAFGLHPACADFDLSGPRSGLKSLFDGGHLGFVCNTGPLVLPLSKSEYNAGAPRPKQLFSHNDQELLWQLGMTQTTDPLAKYGWGGRVAAQAGFTPLPNGLSSAISLAGSARFLVGDGVLPYQLDSGGVNLLDQYSQGAASNNFPEARRAVLDALLGAPQSNPYAREFAATTGRSLAVGEALYGLLESPDGQLATPFPVSSLGGQLAMVARMIKVSRSLGAQRQVYFVRFGSFDLHSGMFVAGQPVASAGHGALLTQLNQAVGAFWDALGEVDARSEVTTFSMSEFARTLSGNGNGSDHAWGGNQFVLGGAVNGGRLYGRYPDLQLDADDNANQDWSFSRGQYIPTTGVEQFGATLARWMGVTDSSALDAIFPNLPNFASRDLGFMA